MLHLIALSFDHRVGNQLDRTYPPFPDEPYVADWKQGLPFIAIPDKADKAHTSVIQFTLPEPSRPCGCVFGIAAYRGIDTTDLQNKEKSFFRNQVQKALCVISSVPLFGELEQPLKDALFKHFDSLVENLDSIFNQLNELCKNSIPFSGIAYMSLFQSLRQDVLLIIRAVLLQKRILFFADNSEIVSKMIVAIASLLPGYLYDSDFPFTFLEKGSGRYTFAPYVPLQYSETLNHSGAKSSLMGTCSELFMEEKVVKYDILVNCRTYPATITGETSDVKLQENEEKWMKGVLSYLKTNWNKDESLPFIREKFTIWMNSLITTILRVRHITTVPYYIRVYLDWDRANVFGEHFLKKLITFPDIDKIIKENDVKKFEPNDEVLMKKKPTALEQFQALFK
ncbi:late secretory pathway protein avl9 [Tritrichomonas musculus]|uniref:Late secretory pathway protein avl9 n=1 Tax=Tritrichomonas musculus TaxID=1915356 RepID=A0ABR2GK79_9EUKA